MLPRPIIFILLLLASYLSVSVLVKQFPESFSNIQRVIGGFTTSGQPQEFIKIASDNWHFETSQSHQPFVPFGCNYYDPATYHLQPFYAYDVIGKFDYGRTDQQFAQMQSLGVNIVRIFLSTGSFESHLYELNQTSLQKLDKIVEIARKHNIRLIIDLLDGWEGESSWVNWEQYIDDTTLSGFEFLVKGIAQHYANEPTIFAYDLRNEPVIWNWSSQRLTMKWNEWVRNKYKTENNLRAAWSDYPKVGENWYDITPPENKEICDNQRLYDYQLFRESIAYNWVQSLVKAIKSVDTNHLVTLGMVPYSSPIYYDNWPEPSRNEIKPSGHTAFDTKKLAPLLDYVSIHAYPILVFPPYDPFKDREKSLNYCEAIIRYGYVNKPIIVEEYGWLTTPENWNPDLINAVKDDASGFASWAYADFDSSQNQNWGLVDTNLNIKAWGNKFSQIAPEITSSSLVRSPANKQINLNMKRMLTCASERQNVLDTYNQLKSSGYTIDFLFQLNNVCSDETPYGECSASKPRYCDNGKIVDKCSVCGCPAENYDCQADGSCKMVRVVGWIDGFHDYAGCDSTWGWVRDTTTTNPVKIKIYDGRYDTGVLLKEITANQYRSDLCNLWDNGNLDCYHGFAFSFPDSIKDKKTHYIYIYGVDSNQKLIILSGSPKTITCSAPPTTTSTTTSSTSSSTSTSSTTSTTTTISAWPHISISAPSGVAANQEFSVSLTYTHDINEQGGIHLRWLNDNFDVVDVAGCTVYNNPSFAQGWKGVECSNLNSGAIKTFRLKALAAGTQTLYYRAWDNTKDYSCGSRYDFNRDPGSGTCSLNCDSFPDDWTACSVYTKSIGVTTTSSSSTSSTTSSATTTSSTTSSATSSTSSSSTSSTTTSISSTTSSSTTSLTTVSSTTTTLPTTTTSSKTSSTTTPTTTTIIFGFVAGETKPANITVDGQQMTVSVSVAPSLDISSINISLQEAVQTSIVSTDVKVLENVGVEYRDDKLVYVVSGYAEELFLGFEVKNFRSVTVDAANGEVISVYKESPILSFVRALVMGALKSWGYK